MIKLKKLIKEELLGNLGSIEVYKNPKSIKRMAPALRGLSDPQGNLYVMDDQYFAIHMDLERWLKNKGHTKDKSADWDTRNWPKAFGDMIKKGYIYWQRKGDSNTFYLSESTYPDVDWFKEMQLMKYLKKSVKKVQQKNPQYKFILKRIF